MEVARNRAGAPLETIQLTERELPLNFREKEDTGVGVRLNWERFDPASNEYSWLDRTKLEGLGFDYAKALRDPQHPQLARPAFVALEYDGPAWAEWLKSVQQAKPGVTQFELFSRLIPVDVAKTPEPLLIRYPDRRRYLVIRGLVQLSVWTFHVGGGQEGQPRPHPTISEVLPGSIHVPAPLSDALGKLPSPTNMASPRYTLTLSYGRHFEPWLVVSAPSQ
jgi:hypothetical protein